MGSLPMEVAGDNDYIRNTKNNYLYLVFGNSSIIYNSKNSIGIIVPKQKYLKL
jgi:hypothetical protein